METIRRAIARPLDSRTAYLCLTILALNLLDAFATLRHLEHGATELNPVGLGDVYYEAKFRSPDGLIVDVGHWAGTSAIPHEAPQQDLAYAGE